MQSLTAKRLFFLLAGIGCIILVFAVFTSAQSQAEFPVTFQVSEKSTGLPLKYVQIEIWNGSVEYAAAQTQTDGSNSFLLPVGNYTYNVAYRESGWEGVWQQPLQVNDSMKILIQLKSMNATL